MRVYPTTVDIKYEQHDHGTYTIETWKLNGALHNIDDLPAEIFNGNEMYWYKHGIQHRDESCGPAIIRLDESLWMNNGKIHRAYGPAIIGKGGDYSWVLHDRIMSFDEWITKTKISDEDKVMVKMQYGK